MFDVHCHILPGVDDGSANLNVSLEMARIAQRQGTNCIIATPHVIEGTSRLKWADIVERCKKLERQLQQEKVEISIHPGAEVALNMDLLDELGDSGAYCLNGGKYLLVELPAMEIPPYTEDFFFQLQARGIFPILAHPERYPAVQANPDQLLEWVRRGILLQVNSSSLSGRMGERPQKVAELLLKNRLIHFLGSDAHSARRRTPDMTKALEKMKEQAGMNFVQQVVEKNPERLLHNESIVFEQLPDHLKTQQKGFLGRLFAGIFRAS